MDAERPAHDRPPQPLDYATPAPPEQPYFLPRPPSRKRAATFVVLFTVMVGWMIASDWLVAAGWMASDRLILFAAVWLAANVGLHIAFRP